MNETLLQKKKELELMQIRFNISKLEVRLLELDEEKIKVQESINEQKAKLNDFEEE